MKRQDIIKKLLEHGTDKSGVLIELATGGISRIVDGECVPTDFEYHLIEDVSIVNNSIVIRASTQGV